MLRYLFLCSLVLAPGCSETGIEGRVVNGFSNEPLAGVDVLVKGTQLLATTDEHGVYRLVGVAPGPQELVLPDAYTILSPLEVTVGDGEVLLAADYVAFPLPPEEGLWALSQGAYSPVPRVEETRFRGGRSGEAIGFKVDDIEAVKPLPWDARIVFYNDELPQEWKAAAIQRKARGDEVTKIMFGSVRSGPFPERYAAGKDAVDAGAVALTPKLAEVKLALTPLEPFKVTGVTERGLAASVWGPYIARIDAGPARVTEVAGKQVLHLPVGTFSSTTEQFRVAREWTISWCKSAEALPDCAAALPLLEAAPETSGNPDCLPSLLVSPPQKGVGLAELATWRCAGGARITFRTDEAGPAVPVEITVEEAVDDGMLDAVGYEGDADEKAAVPATERLTAPWTEMRLPIGRGNILYSDAKSVTVSYQGRTVADLAGEFEPAIAAQGWKQTFRSTERGMVTASYAKEGMALTLAVMEAQGTGTVSLTAISM